MKKDNTPAIQLGYLSRLGESGGDPGIVSTGTGDAGGVSYGLYQMTSKPNGGTVADFVKHSLWRQLMVPGLAPGTPEFSATWRELAHGPQKEVFAASQHEYIKAHHYDLLMGFLDKSGIDFYSRSLALRNVLWATATGAGAGGAHKVVTRALTGRNPAGITDRDIIHEIYAELLTPGHGGQGLHWWAGCSMMIQVNAAKGLLRARELAMRLLADELAGKPWPVQEA